ncbi:MAG TPA: relaxase/mobilization nuclease domain-containing protein [Povalibacter sp.]|uniref:relaxase/mobilization nuclease domain-containing protein n=1 Tax=Povalibacter sp. TaxID=1962978 RepID=UPI002C1DF974|nr:relaxase/mobilization nuclease domain-containing protein [Povalibacter sp.]HMN44677.1 relaxase/mobilization nuclease domain-containing protein [Povalibacter sp.]
MGALRIEPFAGRPLLNIASYGRPGPGRRDRLTPEQVAHIARTVGQTPEVMLKVLTRNSSDLSSVRRHLGYIGRDGELELETDDGERIGGKGIGRQLAEDWNLDLEMHRSNAELTAANGRRPPKLVHKLIFSMPAGTSPKAVESAARNFLREEFGLKHRYAFVLHTDEPHPHVHAVIKAVSEQGQRLNIRKATLRRWRAEFARHLRAHGVAANATERAVRGQIIKAKLDPIYRAMADPRRTSTHERDKAIGIRGALAKGMPLNELGKARLQATRHSVANGWLGIADLLNQQGETSLAHAAVRFMEGMRSPKTETELMVLQLRDHVLQRSRMQAPVR